MGIFEIIIIWLLIFGMLVYLFIYIYFFNFLIFLFMYWFWSVIKLICVIIWFLGLYWYLFNGVSKFCESMFSFYVCICEFLVIVGVGYVNMEFSVWVDYVDILWRELLIVVVFFIELREVMFICLLIDGLCLLWFWIVDFCWISFNF